MTSANFMIDPSIIGKHAKVFEERIDIYPNLPEDENGTVYIGAGTIRGVTVDPDSGGFFFLVLLQNGRFVETHSSRVQII